MLDSQSNFPTTSVTLGLLLGWLAPLLGAFAAVPPWVLQAAVTVVSAPVAAALAVLAKRWARRLADRWFGPDAKRKPGDTDE